MDPEHFVGKDIFLQIICFSVGELAGDVFSSAVSNLPSVLYSLVIIVYNSLYLKLARRLTIWENHRYISGALPHLKAITNKFETRYRQFPKPHFSLACYVSQLKMAFNAQQQFACALKYLRYFP
jgi:hypothetical protein